MHRPSPRRLAFLSTFAFAVFALTFVYPELTSAQSSPPTRKAPPPAPPRPAADQQQFVSYWTTETGWRTELQLRNNQLNQVLTVTPVLRAANGTETMLLPVTIQPQEVLSTDIATAIGSAAPQLIGTYGSIALRYRSSSPANLYAVAMVMGVGHSIAFHIDGIGEDQLENVGGREGIWWLPNSSASDYLILTNQGQESLQVNLSVFDAAGKPTTQAVTLAARAMARYSIRQIVTEAKLAGSYGGINVSAQSHVGSLDTLHVVFEESGGFSAIMKMFDYDPRAKMTERDYAGTGKWTLRAPMLALSTPDPALAFPVGTTLQPQLFVRNATSRPVHAAFVLNWRSGTTTGKAKGPAVTLNPYETRRIDVAALQAGNTIPGKAQWAYVTLTTDAQPGELMAVAASYDKSLHFGAQTPFSDQLAFHWAGSEFQYDAHHNSIITVGNGGAKPTQAAFTIVHNQGTQKYELEQTLQPDEQMWIDIGKLIREGVPDKNGKTLPADLTSGSYDIRDLTNHGIGSLFEGKIIYDKTYGHVTYGCGVCCGYKPAVLWWDPLGISCDGFADNGVNAYDTCSNGEDDVSGTFYGNWTTASSAIATVDTYGTHTGQGVGSTTSATHGNLQRFDPHSFTCPIATNFPGGGDNVAPSITSVSPSRGLIGATTSSVTITGEGLLGGHINTPAAIQVSNITKATETEIVFDAIISDTATPGNNVGAIYVTVSGEASNKVDFFVQVPNSLMFVAGSASGTTENICSPNLSCGTLVSFQYQVLDQDNPARPIMAAMSFWDFFAPTYSPDELMIQGTQASTTCTFDGKTNSGPCGVSTQANGTFTELVLGACSAVCYKNAACTTGGPSGIQQTWEIAGSAIVQSISEYCQQVNVNNVQIK